ncbi:glutathione S-transferase family protein [Devosia sp.]|uniref:glutathione S-transferase family protein n=1 Tax=Devosia sp. TaxID=1871048 RepID=UPI002AFEEEA7|nr:glutathione S-transferase family protein [Devosia sp.]
MSLTLYLHPLASFCHKVLIALYENDTPFTQKIVDLGDPQSALQVTGRWPVGKIPVLEDTARNRIVPETSIIIEYLDRYYPGPVPLLPEEPEAALDTRLWDRFFDQYVQVPMQKIVIDRIRPPGAADPHGVAEARDILRTAYGMIEGQMAGRDWAVGGDFSLADCAAAPGLFFAAVVEPFPADHPNLAAYFERLLARPSVARALAEARPYFDMFPYRDAMPARFLAQ